MTFTGCRKEENTKIASNSLLPDNELISKLEEFKELTNTVNLVDHIQLRTQNYTIDEALELLDESMNYMYCRPDNDMDSVIVFEQIYDLTVSPSNQVSSVDLALLANTIATSMGNQYHALNITSKKPFLFDIKQSDNLIGNSLPIKAIFQVSIGTSSNSVTPYSPGDDWRWGWDQGKCDISTPVKDATDLFRADLNNNIAFKGGNQVYFFSKIYSVCNANKEGSGSLWCNSWGIPDKIADNVNFAVANEVNLGDQNPADADFAYKLFRVIGDGYLGNVGCLGYNEMNYHYREMASRIQQYKPQGKVTARVHLGFDQTLNGEYSLLSHFMVVQYGMVNIAISNQTTLPCTTCPPNPN